MKSAVCVVGAHSWSSRTIAGEVTVGGAALLC